MLIDARTIPAGTTFEVDVCVVGCGAAGTILGMELAAPGRTVLILESGAEENEEDTAALNDAAATGNPYPIELSRLRFLGGTTNHWAGHCWRWEEDDFEGRDWVEGTAWPIPLSAIEPFYPKAFSTVMFGQGRWSWDPDEWRRIVATSKADAEQRNPLHGAVFRQRIEQFSPIWGDHARSFKHYIPQVAQAPGMKVLLRANLIGVETDPERTRVVGLEAGTLEGGRFRIHPRQTVLAAGGLENARLLLQTETPSAPALGNAHDQVGRHFSDHIAFYETLVPPSSGWIDPLLRLDRVPTPFGCDLMCNFRLNPSIQKRERMSSILFRLLPRRPESIIAARRLSQRLASLQFDRQVARDFSVFAGSLPEIGRYAWRRALVTDAPPAEFDVQVRIEPPPLPGNRITLTDERDALGLRRLNLHWDIDPLSYHTARRGIELFAAEAARLGLGRMHSTFLQTGAFPERFEVGYHHCGTTRMSADPAKGVVDPNGRVWGVANLHIAGSGVFVTAGSGSPTMMIAAMTLRLAEHLKQVLA